MNAEKLIRGTLAHIDKSLDNVADLDVVWENAEVVEVLEEVRSLLVTGEINPGSFEKAQAPTDDEREDMIAWLMRDQGDDLSPLGRDYTDAEIADMLRRPAQTEPTDAQMIAALNAWHQDVMPVTRLGVFGTQKEDLMRAALIAAFKEGSMK